MFKGLFNFKRKRLGHIPIKTKMCVLPLIYYDDKTETLDYGQCFTIDVISMSVNSMTVRHNNVLKKGNILEFRTKHALEDRECLKCINFKLLPETPSFSSFIGKIIWRSNEEAGVNIIMMREQDKAAILKMMANKSKK
ncbi:MAG: hypothetical protein K2N11_03965 [Mucispirillum sp.]|nr:hypothetical protein [Mucispirillum sp.]